SLARCLQTLLAPAQPRPFPTRRSSDLDAWFNVGMMQKDLQLALDQGHATGVTLPTTALAQQWLTMARGLGLAERDFGTLFDVLAGLSGLPPSPNRDGRASRSRSTGEASL